MEAFKPNTHYCSHVALLAVACLIAPLIAGETQTGSSLAGSELSRRSAAVDEAQELLRKGDEAYGHHRGEELAHNEHLFRCD